MASFESVLERNAVPQGYEQLDDVAYDIGYLSDGSKINKKQDAS